MPTDLSAANRHVCPKCKAGDTLWESVVVQGWRSINEHLEPEGERDVDWTYAERDHCAYVQVGCGECSWEGQRSELEQVGIDGNPLQFVHPDQLEISS